MKSVNSRLCVLGGGDIWGGGGGVNLKHFFKFVVYWVFFLGREFGFLGGNPPGDSWN